MVLLIIMILVSSCSKKLQFNSYFEEIKNSGFMENIKYIQYYGPLRYKNQDVRFLMTDIEYSSYVNGKINFIDIDTPSIKTSIKIDTNSINNLYLLLATYEKKYYIQDIEQNRESIKIYFDLKYFDKDKLPSMRSDYFENNEMMNTGVLEKVLADSLRLQYDRNILEAAAKLSDNWYFYYLK